MRINIVIPFTLLTGGIRVIFLYANYLVDKGHSVVFYVPIKSYKFNWNTLKRFKVSLGNIKRGTRLSWFNNNFEIKLVPYIGNIFIRDADISIATAWPTAYDVYKLDTSKGEKVYFVQDYEIWSGYKEAVDLSYKLPLNKIVITKSLKELLKEKFNEDSYVIYNGIDKKEFINSEVIVQNHKTTIVMLYNEAPNKGCKEGIDILQKIKNTADVEVVLFGFKKGQHVPEEFIFYENPERKELLKIYRGADIYVFTSKEESWGLPVIEAMANKCAVVGNNVGCLKEIGINNVNCKKIEGLDYRLMQEEIMKLLNDEQLLYKIKENGYKTAQKFNWEESYNKFERYLLNLVRY